MTLNELTSTDYVAIIGALTGSLALGWDILKWFRDGARLKVSIRPNTYYEDGEALSVENHDNGTSEELASYYHIEIVNRGNLPTTLLGVEGSTKSIGLSKLFDRKKAVIGIGVPRFIPHFGKKYQVLLTLVKCGAAESEWMVLEIK